ncbi:hypothetical protein NEOLEDRAFT_1126642 [Neolentinus lepideus HHB14362 ss-1]|uniref:F-box domain-containing protein n=1 Tax=Neolentinus lepideus HHB14362 ss-1 TaxID=1314782 RepID=A0A165WBU5_9AGAM|nr:hypothetical protein NEOLEDRAFT_1126642 [Neolentinus lepideus HHB14362 ss-1]
MTPHDKAVSPSRATSPANLPPETWLMVFRWATWPPPHVKHPAVYRPFIPPSDEAELAEMISPLEMKRTLVLVCKRWRQFSLQLLYEFLILNSPRQVATLANALDENEEYRGYVKSVLLRPLGPMEDMRVHPRDVLEILGRCPNILIIMKPWWLAQPSDDLRGHPASTDHSHTMHEPAHPALFPDFVVKSPVLTRLDWEYSCSMNAAFFHDFVGHSPELRYLYVTCVSQCFPFVLSLDSPVAVPTVTTLRLNVRNPYLFNAIQKWHFPALTHLIVESGPSELSQMQMQALVQAFSSTLKVVELGAHMRFMLTDYLTPILTDCRSLDTLAFYISFVELPDVEKELEAVPWAVKHVRVYIKPNLWSEDTHPGLPVVPMNVLHLARWCTSLTGLEFITLHGDWQAVWTDSHKDLVNARRILKGGGWRIELGDSKRAEFSDACGNISGTF